MLAYFDKMSFLVLMDYGNDMAPTMR